MRKLIVPFAIAAAAIATPALAQSASPFTGARAEGIIGWDRVQNDGGKSGVAYGFGVGYDTQMSNLVVGLEGEFADSTTKTCARDFAVAGDRLCSRTGRDLYVGARVGTLLNENTLLYGKAGYTNARFKLAYDDGATGVDDFRVSDNYDGLRLGAGLEYAIGPNSFVKGEYRYSNYEAGFEKHQVVAGFGFRF